MHTGAGRQTEREGGGRQTERERGRETGKERGGRQTNRDADKHICEGAELFWKYYKHRD
jgi:hypothetical protein